MTSLSTFWSRLRPWVWPSSDDLNPLDRPLTDAEQKELNDHLRVGRIEDQVKVLQDQANHFLSIRTNIDPYYIRIASQSFMEHMNRVEGELQKRVDMNCNELNTRIQDLTHIIGAKEHAIMEEMAKLKAETTETSDRIAKLLARLKGLGDSE